jgi:hypothetical protein
MIQNNIACNYSTLLSTVLYTPALLVLYAIMLDHDESFIQQKFDDDDDDK